MSSMPRPPLTRLPVEIRHVALTATLVFVSLAALRLADGLVVPLVLSMLTAVALAPLVRGLERLRLPRPVAAGAVVGGFVLLLAFGGYELSDDAVMAARRLPQATERLREALRVAHDGPGTALSAIARAADDLEAAATEAAGGSGAARARQTQPVALGLRGWLVFGSMSLVGFAGQFLLLIFLVYFLLASGDSFKRRIVKLAGPSLARRRRAVCMINGIFRSLERFMVVVVATNAIVAVATWLLLTAFGMKNAAIWALCGGVLNTVPYVGSAVAAGLYFVVALLQFETLEAPVLIVAGFLVITSLEGMWLKPYWMGRAARLNNVVVFAGLLFWGWLWGPWGMLLAYPILMVAKTVADHVEGLHPVAEMLRS